MVVGTGPIARLLQFATDKPEPTFVLYTIPKPSEAHHLAILAFGEVRDFLFAVVLLQPLVEALCYDNAPLFLLHACPHAAVLVERVITTVDRLQHGTVVGVAFRPEGNQTWRRADQSAQ